MPNLHKSKFARLDLLFAVSWTLVTILACITFIDHPLEKAISVIPGETFARLRQLTILGNSMLYLIPLSLLLGFLGVMTWQAESEGSGRAKRWLGRLAFVFTAIVVSGVATNPLKVIIGLSRRFF